MTTPYRAPPAAPPRAVGVPVLWVPREPPLSVCAAVAFGECAAHFVARLLRLDDRALASLVGVASRDVVVIEGEGARIPWVDGVHWLGRDVEAPALRLPTSVRPAVPPALFQQAVLARCEGVARAAVVPSGSGLRVVPLGEALPLDRDRLRAWLAERAP